MLLLAAFILIASLYPELPSDIVITRALFGGDPVTAPKTLFTALRPPLIELICALAVMVMLRRNVSADVCPAYSRFWLILLYTVGFKSLFQAFEIIAPPTLGPMFYYVTIAVVVLGIVCAAPFGWSLYSRGRGEWNNTPAEKLQLSGLLAMYLLVAVLPIWIYR